MSKTRKYVITIAGSDFLITFNGRTFPLDWSEDDRISIKELSDILHDPWSSVNVYSTDYGCEDCDGYDYSGCDMSRCKNDCEHCGGRRYICNNSCFYHRYNSAIKIETVYSEIEKDLQPVRDKMDEYLAPRPNNQESLFEHIQAKFKEFEDRMDLFESHNLGISFGITRDKYAKCSLLHSYRNIVKSLSHDDMVKIQVGTDVVKTLRQDVKIFRKGVLFWKSYHLVPTKDFIYDIDSDRLISFDYEIICETNETRDKFVNNVQNCKIGKVVLNRIKDGRYKVVNETV